MLKNTSQLMHTLGGKIYQFMCDMDSPLNDVKEALFQFQKYIGQIEDNIKAQEVAKSAQMPQNAEVPPVSEESKSTEESNGV